MNVIPKIRPRRWQQEALKCWARDLRGVARVVTGGGKTVFAYLCIEEFLKRFPDGRVVIVVPTIALLDQWFVDICDSMDVLEEQIACYSGESHPDCPGKINILVLNTARRAGPEISEGTDQPTILIVDECHRAGSPENALALQGIGDVSAARGAHRRWGGGWGVRIDRRAHAAPWPPLNSPGMPT